MLRTREVVTAVAGGIQVDIQGVDIRVPGTRAEALAVVTSGVAATLAEVTLAEALVGTTFRVDRPGAV